jgi:GT2 family glycosyltransferase
MSNLLTAKANNVRVISVSFHSEHVIQDMLKSLPTGVEVIVVDNSETTSENMRQLRDEHGFKYVPLTRNRGFGAACNEGAKDATCEFLFFLNPDARLVGDSLDHLLRAMHDHPEVVAANPLIRGSRGKVEFKYRSVLLPRQEWCSRKPPEEPCDMPALTGSALMVRREAFEAVGGFDERIFLYHEDDDLSIRLRQQVGPLLFVPKANVHHNAGHSSERSPAMAFHKAFHKAQSRVYAMRKHQISRPIFETLVSALLGLINPTNLISRRKRLQAWGFFLGTLSAKES